MVMVLPTYLYSLLTKAAWVFILLVAGGGATTSILDVDSSTSLPESSFILYHRV
jgi:hypothetical protein